MYSYQGIDYRVCSCCAVCVALAQHLAWNCGFARQAPEGVLPQRNTFFVQRNVFRRRRKKRLHVSFSPGARNLYERHLFTFALQYRRINVWTHSDQWFSNTFSRIDGIFLPPAAHRDALRGANTPAARNSRNMPAARVALQQTPEPYEYLVPILSVYLVIRT